MILILDFGSQYTQLIARRIREAKVYCEIHPFSISPDAVAKLRGIKGVIFSGGPDSVYERGAPRLDRRTLRRFLDDGVPILGICYGMQFLAQALGGSVARGRVHEYGFAKVRLNRRDPFFSGISGDPSVWMSHGDTVKRLPPGFARVAHTANGIMAAMADHRRRIVAVQFHPEVRHTRGGTRMLQNFVYGMCGEKPSWRMKNFVRTATAEMRTIVQDAPVICGLSGGVDSSVAAVMAHRAIGDQLHCVFVNNGVLRHGEEERVRAVFGPMFGRNMHVINAAARFLGRLKGVTDPERKRRIIGRTFIEVFEEAARIIQRRIGRPFRFLLQGTLYPDVIESVSVKGPSKTIKTHHNVGGLPRRMRFALLEPLRFLFKDEVRELGRELGMPAEILNRQPFPGPGLAVRILGEVTAQRSELLRRADRIIDEEVRAAGLYERIWQSFGVLLPVRTVGIMGDNRTYEHVIALRAVESQDAMTADWVRLPYDVLGRISNRIINEVRGINRVVYDISSKPPATIEWE